MQEASTRRAALRPLRMGALLALLVQLPGPSSASTILTFDVSGGATNFQAVPEDYGDRVTGTPQAGHAYLLPDDGLGPTPNVVADYGTPGELPALWTNGYGDLANVYYNDQDGDTTLTLTLTADPGIHAVLQGFDLASYSAAGQTLPGFSVLDGGGATLFAQGPTPVAGSSNGGHVHIDLVSEGIAANVVALVIDLTGLGTVSDNIGIDNVAFSQVVPEPGTGLLMSLGVLALAAFRTRRSSVDPTRGRGTPTPR